MRIICLDLEGVLVPEIWQNVAARTGIDELNLTTRDIPDYHELMGKRLQILDDHGITLGAIQEVIGAMEPLPGAREFLDDLRSVTQVVLLSDTFQQFAGPLMKQLGWPTLLCNALEVANDRITGYRLRQENGKYHAVRAFQSMALEVYAAGDSWNDLAMILEADRGAFFTPPQSITDAHPEVPVCMDYETLYRFAVG